MKRLGVIAAAFAVSIALAAVLTGFSESVEFDLISEGGLIVDGSGSARYKGELDKGDIGIRRDRGTSNPKFPKEEGAGK
jgi:hypothetical protein